MESILVNADYEIELFQGKKGSSLINKSLEFLALFLCDNPLFTRNTYPSEYLDHVEKLTGHRPVLVKSGPASNWWGPLKNIEHERWMNSKLTSAELDLAHGWSEDLQIIRESKDRARVKVPRQLLAKDAFGMSGMGLKAIRSIEDLHAIKSFPTILEPLLNRTHDFSHYLFPDGKCIAYQNLVDNKFQYRGTIFKNHLDPVANQLSFKHLLSDAMWYEFNQALMIIKTHYMQKPLETGFSVDSFVYEEAGKHKIHILCEVNYRRTMGRVAYELAGRFAKERPWCLFLLTRMDSVNFGLLQREVSTLENVMLLSPPEGRYQMFLLSAEDEEKGRDLFKALKQLLPYCQFAVDI
ncbi:MAG TPA: hypothetical protein VNJ08_17200 [Bacteriovoracaceae bacterium]|nr:hypothetical protein [Bacteriovoracaceae bacterium]